MSITHELVQAGELRDRRAHIAAEAAAYQLQAASSALEGVRGMIQQFEATLEDGEEIAMLVIGGPSGEVIFPAAIEASGPDRLIFTGTTGTDQRVCMVIQHVSQLNLMLKSVKVENRDARRVFRLVSQDDMSAGRLT